MNLSDYGTSIIRTAVPAAVGVAVTWLAKHVGVSIPAGQASAAAVGLVMVAYYAAVRWAETRWPQAGWLLGVPHAPSYKPPKAFIGGSTLTIGDGSSTSGNVSLSIDQIPNPIASFTFGPGGSTVSDWTITPGDPGAASPARPKPSQPNNPAQPTEKAAPRPRKAPAKKAPAKKVAKRTAKKAAPRKRA